MKLKHFIFGLIIGVGFIIPGVSGGVIATILGIYDEIIYRLNHIFNNAKENILFITPILAGIILSVFLFSKIIMYLFDTKLIFISYVFIGLILGCIPYLIQEIKIKTSKSISLVPFFISFSLGFLLFFLQQNLHTTSYNLNPITMLLAGFLYALGKIVPGISGASLLILLGVYKYFLGILANPLSINTQIIILFIPFIISFIISAIIILKIIDFLLHKYFRITYSLIIGFVITSILFIYPHYFSLSCFLITVSSFFISYYLSKQKNNGINHYFGTKDIRKSK